MLFTSRISQLSLILTITLLQLAYGEETTHIIFYAKPVIDYWPESYYVIYGFVVAAIVLFIMAVMKKHDEMHK